MSIKMYQCNSNSTTRKIRLFLQSYDIAFSTVKICEDTFSLEDFYKVLELTESGAYDLISDRSTVYKDMKKQGFDFDSLKLSELYTLIMENPSLLKTPIVVDFPNDKLIIGNDMELLSKIVPKDLRR